MTLIYRNTPYNKDGIVRIPDSMPEEHKKMWLAALAGFNPDPPIFEPTFIPGTISSDNGMGGVILQDIGTGEGDTFWSQFATKETAEYIAGKFGTGELVEIDPGYAGGVAIRPATAWGIKTKDGRTMNAGMLASIIVRMNATDNGYLADQFVNAFIANSGKAAQ
jgi:hypothetical protein